ncbi:MAG: Coenzyme F420 hydrogenase/dehydrogenase, beta subunit C-terminal domain [Methanomicrobiaceae archaeon]|nr:Coenzyme F420 hydrogenase/dehydrogenase, beta subunit C-terminal domain [Methanomicrobiaceae archaeon]
MVAKGDMLYTWTNNADIAKSAECGGAVTGLLHFALENKMVDGVLAVKKGVDLYDAVPVVITDPEELNKTAGSLHTGTLLLSKLVATYLEDMKDKKIAMAVKGCDLMGLIELARRDAVNLDNILLIGLNCGGTVSPVTARKMIKEKFGINPDDVVKEEIDKGQFIVITKDGEHKGISIDDLEEEDYGRRSNCRRCLYKVPREADLACGNWGVIGDKAGRATFVEVCSDKGSDLMAKAMAAGAIATEPANPKGIEIRGKVEGAMKKLGQKWRDRDFSALNEDLWGTIERETGRCVKCYSCIDQCPVCFTDPEQFQKDSRMIRRGGLPVDPMFHLRRFAHISDTCVNCGQCEELCPMEIPLALFSHAIRTEGDLLFEPKLGKAPYTN